ALKRLCFIASDCFMKFQNHPEDAYGKVYVQRKEYETKLNNVGGYSEQAATILTAKDFKRDTKAKECYTKGVLPPGHIHMRCLRYPVMFFFSHLHNVMYEDWLGKPPPVPYIFSEAAKRASIANGLAGDHRHYIPPPNWPFADVGKRLTEMGA